MVDKQFEDMMRKKVEIDRLVTEKDAIAFWHAKLIGIQNEQALASMQIKIKEIIRTMETRMSFLERERKNDVAMTKIILSLFIVYGCVALLLFLFQRSVIYYPHKLDKQFSFPPYAAGQEEVFITCDDGCVINGLFISGRDDKPAVLIFHGNAGNITHRDFLLREFSRLGCAALLIDYHGYGKSEGTPTEKNLYLDAEASLAWLAAAEEAGAGPGGVLRRIAGVRRRH